MDPHQIGYDEARTTEFYRQLEARARALPGVQSVSFAFGIPMAGSVNTGTVTFEGQTVPCGQQPPSLFFNSVDPTYFETLRVPLLRGRAFTESDNQTAPPVVIVNQTMADKFWPHQDALGKRFSLKTATGPAKTMQVVGVAANGKYLFIAEDPTPFFYVPLAQNYTSVRALQVRSSVPPERLLAPVQAEIHKLAPDLPVTEAKTMKQSIGDDLLEYRLGAGSGCGDGRDWIDAGGHRDLWHRFLLGCPAHPRNRHPYGARGSARDVMRLILQQGVRMVVIGLAVGLLAALGITRVMTGLLVGVSPSDPLTYATVALVLSAVALLACWLPARRATRVDPGVALRYE